MKSIPTDRIIEKLDMHLSKNDYDAAERHLSYWYGEAEACGDTRGKLTLTNELIGLHRKLGNRENALHYADAVISLVSENGLDNTVSAGTAYVNAATAYKAFGLAEKAMPLFEKARDIYEKELPENDARLGGLYNNMALALVDLKEFSKADVFYKKALSVMEKNDRGGLEMAITYLNMATAAECEHGLEKADDVIAQMVEKAISLLDEEAGATDGYYAFVCEKCATVFGYYGYFMYERKLSERAKRIYEGS